MNLLPISTQVLPAGSTRDPGAHRGLAPRDGLGGGQGTSPGVASGTSRGGGWRPSPASAAPLPCCHSNALGPPPQHPAASRSIPQHGARARDGDTAQPSPHSPHSGQTPPAVPTPSPRYSSPRPVSAALPGEGGRPPAARAAPSPPSQQDRGGWHVEGSTGHGSDELLGNKPSLGSLLYTRVVQQGNVTSSNTPGPHLWANTQTRVAF